MRSICCPSQPEPTPLQESPGRKLHRSIEKSDTIGCRYLLETRVQPTAVDEVTNETPLEAAILHANPEVLKLLVDHGAIPSRDDRLHIKAQLEKLKTPPSAIKAFLTPLPDLYAPEIFYEGQFVSLPSFPGMSAAQAGFERSLVLYCIGQDTLGSHYGAIIRSSFEPWENGEYAEMAREFTVVRVLVDDKNRLVSTIDQIKELLPGLPLLHLCLNAHGSSSGLTLGIGDNGRITKDDKRLFHELVRRIHILGTLAILGCHCANGPENFVKWLSLHVDGRLVCGAPGSVLKDFRYVVDSDIPNFPIILSYFEIRSDEANPVTAVYFCGQLVWQGSLNDSAKEQELAEWCLAWSLGQAKRLLI
jgi:hypothetical protein